MTSKSLVYGICFLLLWFQAQSEGISAVAGVMSGGSTMIDGGIAGAYNDPENNPLIAMSGTGSGAFPNAYLNYILFDDQYKPLAGRSFPVQNLPNTRHTVQFDQPVTAQQAGYLFVYLSFDDNSTQAVYFDDLRVVVDESPVIQVNNYYPFGMVSSTWLREGEQNNANLFQGKELISQTGWHDFGSRMYWADLGRWFAADPQKQFSSPYAGMGNIPTMGRDPNGEVFIPILLAALQWVGYTNMAFSVGQAFVQGGWQAAGQALGSNAFSLGIGMVTGAAVGGILPDITNTMGTFKGAGLGGVSGALGGGLAGGITSLIGGGDFWEGFGNGALTGGITGALAGGYWGYKNALNAGKNVWWGTDPKDSRSQTSFFNSHVAKQVGDPITLQGAPSSPTLQRGPNDCMIANAHFQDQMEGGYGWTYDEIEEYLQSQTYNDPTSNSPKPIFDPKVGTNTEAALQKLHGIRKVTSGSQTGKVISDIGSHMQRGNPTVVAISKNHAVTLTRIEHWVKGNRQFLKIFGMDPNKQNFVRLNTKTVLRAPYFLTLFH